MSTLKVTKVISGVSTKTGKAWKLAAFDAAPSYDATTNTIIVPAKQAGANGKSFICSEDDDVYDALIVGVNIQFN